MCTCKYAILTALQKRGFAGENTEKHRKIASDITSNNHKTNEQVMSKTEQFLDYIKQAKSKNTCKSYKRGIALFEEFYGKSSKRSIKEPRSHD